ncbi:MAG TPA: protein phosphatase 2C domain-containing protein [Burkholderiaceae bacterium]|nr:protein phosphatase 2C domain-containing protein [Burkholderiaceae bacterium]
MRFSIYQESKKGGRRVNQDRMGYLYTRDSLLLLVADGMGGHARGEVAAQLTLQTMAAMYQRDAKPLLPDPARFLEESVLAAHRELHRYRAEHSLPEAPRTTIVACVVQQGLATWAHAGDSRLYLIRGSRIVERTIDHSRVHHLVSSGLIRPEDAKDHPERNRIFNCIGAYVAPTVEISKPVALRNGDTLLLCTDGLWGTLTDRQIAEGFAGKTVMRAVPELMETALANGGPDADNCTAVAMTWAGTESVDMVPPTEAPVSTLVMPDGAVTSTVQFPRHAELGADEELTEDKIDEAVAEIQRAIQRSAKLVDGKK